MDQPQDPNQISPTQQQPQSPQQMHVFTPAKRNNMVLGIIIAAVLVIAGGAFAFWQYQAKNNDGNLANENNGNQVVPTPTESPDDSTPGGDYMGTPPVCKNSGPILASKSGTVEWGKPEIVEGLVLFGSTTPESIYGGESSRLVGHFVSGKYGGGDLLMTSVNWNEPGGPSWFFVVKQGNVFTFLNKYSDPLPNSSDTKPKVNLVEDKEFSLVDLDFPQTLHSTNPVADFTLATNLGFYKNGTEIFCADHYVKVFTDPTVGDVYTDAGTETIGTGPYAYAPKFGFYVKAPTGMQLSYKLDVSFAAANKVPLLTWDKGQKNSLEYSFQHIGGCGVSQFLDIVNIDQSALTQIGSTFDGQAVYGYKDGNSQELKDMYDSIYVEEGKTKPSYNTFLADHPIFFWKDQFGQFVRFKIMKYQPLAECGKPVIYLYPETTQKISVKLNPVGGFTKSEPAYNSGWNVISDPLSNITNLADGIVYPYLFWEGRGGMYQTPEKGFVIAKAEVHSFLVEKLNKMGLNDKETADFMEFWEPKMQSSPYYFVTFMGNNIMDQLAPLSITPKPDTVIRILMDFTPLEHPITVEGFKIRTPVRKGFTVVEWGGVLR